MELPAIFTRRFGSGLQPASFFNVSRRPYREPQHARLFIADWTREDACGNIEMDNRESRLVAPFALVCAFALDAGAAEEARQA